MQVALKPGLEKRCRYYHSQMDMNTLSTSVGYEQLPDAYVIFICDFDPFGEKKYRYTYENRCRETGQYLQDGNRTVFLSTHGENDEEVPAELVKFLKFVKADLKDSDLDYDDDFVKRLQDAIQKIKSSRDMEDRYMLLEELLRDKKAEGLIEGLIEGIFELLKDLGPIPADVEQTIRQEHDSDVLKIYLKAASGSFSMGEFLNTIKENQSNT